MRTLPLLLTALLVSLTFACGTPEEQTPPPDAGVLLPPPDAGQVEVGPAWQFGTGEASSVTLTEIAGEGDGLLVPRDLAFNPMRPDELWVVNNGLDPVKGEDSTVIIHDASTDGRVAEHRKDAFAMHFMPFPSSIAFGANETTIGYEGTFATCHESRNTYEGQAAPNDFMGPALWSSHPDVFAMHDPHGLGSHLDMLHGSPDCMGIAWERDNVYWVFGGKAHDGQANQRPTPAIVRYDFALDHGIGADDHADGTIHQYMTNEVMREPGIPSHLIFDPASKLLYIADTGNGRVLALDTTSGTEGRNLQGQEPLVAYKEMTDAEVTVVIPPGQLIWPSGIELKDDLLFVSDNATGIISAFTLEGERVKQLDTGLGTGMLAGMAFGPDDKLYFVDMGFHRVLRIDPK